MPDIPEEAVEAISKVLPARTAEIAGDGIARRLVQAALPAIRAAAVEEEHERLRAKAQWIDNQQLIPLAALDQEG